LLDDPHAYLERSKLIDKQQEYNSSSERQPYNKLLSNILYINIPTLYEIKPEDLENVFLPYKDVSEGLIIDLRFNGGGSEYSARLLAEKYLIKNGEHVAGTNVKIAPEGGLKRIKVPVDSENYEPYDKPIVILTSKRTFSAAERFTALMKTGTDCILIGTETAGGSANPVKYEFEYNKESYVVNILTWRYFLEGEDKPIEETKIKPDIFYEGDDIVDFAVRYIKNTKKLNS